MDNPYDISKSDSDSHSESDPVSVSDSENGSHKDELLKKLGKKYKAKPEYQD